MSFSPKELYLSGWSLAVWLPLSGVIVSSPTNFRGFLGYPPKLSLFSPNRIGERPLEIIVTQGTPQIFEMYPFIKIPATGYTTRYSVSPAIEDLSVIWWLQGPADNCAPPINKNIMEFGARGAGLCGLGNLEKYF